MNFFSVGKKRGVLDLTGKPPQKTKENVVSSQDYIPVETPKQKEHNSVPTAFGFFGNKYSHLISR